MDFSEKQTKKLLIRTTSSSSNENILDLNDKKKKLMEKYEKKKLELIQLEEEMRELDEKLNKVSKKSSSSSSSAKNDVPKKKESSEKPINKTNDQQEIKATKKTDLSKDDLKSKDDEKNLKPKGSEVEETKIPAIFIEIANNLHELSFDDDIDSTSNDDSDSTISLSSDEDDSTSQSPSTFAFTLKNFKSVSKVEEALENMKLQLKGTELGRELINFKVFATDTERIAFINEESKVFHITDSGIKFDPTPDGARQIWNNFKFEIECRVEALKLFVSDICKENPDFEIFLEGHSLGADILFEFAISSEEKKNQNYKRIQKVYCFNRINYDEYEAATKDLPLNLKDVRTQGYEPTKSLKHKLIPESYKEKIKKRMIEIEPKPEYSNAGLGNFLPEKIANVKTEKGIGGIDLSQALQKEYSFRGMIFSEELKSLLLLTENNNKSEKVDGVKVKDLAVALKYLSTARKNHLLYEGFSFSLDPNVESDPYGPDLKKVFFPTCCSELMEGTETGETLFQADWDMKLITMGVKMKEMEPRLTLELLTLPQELISLGVKPTYLVRKELDEHRKAGDESFANEGSNWARYWIVIKKIEVLEKVLPNGSKIFEIGDLQMGVDARTMTQDPQTGVLKDSTVQDKLAACYHVACSLTKNYDAICKYYPSFKKVKELAKAMTLAKIIFEQKLPINEEAIEELYQSSKKSLNSPYKSLVPSLKFEHIVGTKETETSITTYTSRVFGGVDLSTKFDIKTDLSTVSVPTVCAKQEFELKYNENMQKLSLMSKEEIQKPFVLKEFLPGYDLIRTNILQNHLKCHDSGIHLSISEAYICEDENSENNSQIFSKMCHPNVCFGCGKFFFNCSYFNLTMNSKPMELIFGIKPKFHKECFKCCYSKESLNGVPYQLDGLDFVANSHWEEYLEAKKKKLEQEDSSKSKKLIRKLQILRKNCVNHKNATKAIDFVTKNVIQMQILKTNDEKSTKQEILKVQSSLKQILAQNSVQNATFDEFAALTVFSLKNGINLKNFGESLEFKKILEKLKQRSLNRKKNLNLKS